MKEIEIDNSALTTDGFAIMDRSLSLFKIYARNNIDASPLQSSRGLSR